MECSLCFEQTCILNRICNTCRHGICENCIQNLEKYKIGSCPFCRTKLTESIKFKRDKLIKNVLLTFAGSILYIGYQYIIPFIIFYYNKYLNENEKYIATYLLSLCFFFIQNITFILASYSRVLLPTYTSLTMFIAYYFIMNSIFLFVSYAYPIDIKFIIGIYLFILYILPFIILSLLPIKKFLLYIFRYLKIEHYKYYKIKILGSATYLDL